MDMKEQQKRPALCEVMAYHNERVIGSFLKSFELSENEARDIFEQVKCMLWLGNEMDFDGFTEQGKAFSIDRSLLILDEMWHTFILCTKDYKEFCEEFFGHFIHHYPQVESEAKVAQRKAEFADLDQAQRIARLADEKRWQYTYVFKKLGKDIFIKWYTDFHQKYTPQHLMELRQQKLHSIIAAAA
jgi:hypothetical protein